MRLTRLTVAALAAAIGGATACDRTEAPREPVTVTLWTDSMISVRRDTAEDGTVQIECPVSIRAEVTGPEGAYAIMRRGTIEFIWWANGNPAVRHDFAPQRTAEFWQDSVIPAGQTRWSHEQVFRQQEPARPVRGTAVFRYATSTDTTETETAQFRFYCY